MIAIIAAIIPAKIQNGNAIIVIATTTKNTTKETKITKQLYIISIP